MPITVRELLDLPGLGLTLVAGAAGLDHPIRWAHTSELQDPTPWLSGGEFLLTTGMGLEGSPALQRAYIRRLVSADLAGLGFGVGFGFETVPAPIVRAAEREGFPVVEVPYPVPFIAITEAVSSRLSDDRLKDAQMSVEVHERLASLVLEGAGPADVLDEVAALGGGWSILFDRKGAVLASSQNTEGLLPETRAVWDLLPDDLREGGGKAASDTGPHGAQVALPVVAGKRNEGVLVFGKERRLDQRDRIVVHHAVTVLGLLLAARRAVIDAEWRVTGDLLSDALSGEIGGDALVRRLERVGFPPGAPVTILVAQGFASGDHEALRELAWAADSSLGPRARAVRTTVFGSQVVAAISHEDPEGLARRLAADLAAASDGREIRVGVGESVAGGALEHSYLTAIFALRAGASKLVVTPRDLGSYGLLLGAQSRPVLEGFVSSVLGSLIERDAQRSSHLVASVKAFVEAGGRWEAGAEALGVHRHTLRYRVRQAEDLLGRDLSDEEDRLEILLALKALEILGADARPTSS